MTKARFFRVATEGATTDGRTIDRAWIDQMVATYKPETFAARVNIEHVRGIAPDGVFGSYGDVLSLKAEDFTLDVGGKSETRRALYAEIQPLDNLVTLTKSGQKLFTSIEINPNFAGTGKAYLQGIAVTDNPAVLGTEMLQFCAGKGAGSPLAHRKLQPDNLFTAAEEITLDFTDTPQPGAEGEGVGGIIGLLKTLLGFAAQAPAASAPAPAAAPAAGTSADKPAAFSAASLLADPALAAVATSLLSFAEKASQTLDSLTQRQAATDTQLAEMKTALERTAPHSFTQRPNATGADDAERADC